MFALPDLRVVHLVRDQPQIVVDANLGDTIKCRARINRAGRVIGRVDQHAFGICRVFGDIGRTGLEGVLGACLDGFRNGRDPTDRPGYVA